MTTDNVTWNVSKTKNYIILWLLATAIITIIWFFIFNQFSWASSVKPQEWTGNWNNADTINQVLDPNIGATIDEKTEESMLMTEKQKLVEQLNASILPNYMKISNWKEFESFWTFKAENVTFFTLSFAPHITEETLADYDVYVIKWHDTPEEYYASDALYKQKIEHNLKEDITKWRQKKIIEKWVVWTITKLSPGNYQIDFLWDFIIDKWGKSKKISADLAAEISVLWEYFNFWEVYLMKEGDDVAKLMYRIEEKLQDKEFSTLVENLHKVYFRDFKKK